HIAEEIWVKLGLDGLASEQAWPAHDPAMLIESEVEMPVQVNGKLRTKLMVPAEADGAAVEKLALADEKVKAAVEGKTVRKIVVVPGRMVNIVVG
ncbi:MAG TPA: class I tRNA ligase family protein, partial [Phycisphaerales bacterium]|nr:class I tRNA ligase family protein [Phycisphaerales bacterium]